MFGSGNQHDAAPGHEKFPGSIDMKNPNFKYEKNVPFTFNAPGRDEYFQTGYYAAAGQTI